MKKERISTYVVFVPGFVYIRQDGDGELSFISILCFFSYGFNV